MSKPRPGEDIDAFFERTWGAVVGAGFRKHQDGGMQELVDLLRERPTPRAGVLNRMRAIAGWSGVSTRTDHCPHRGAARRRRPAHPSRQRDETRSANRRRSVRRAG